MTRQATDHHTDAQLSFPLLFYEHASLDPEGPETIGAFSHLGSTIVMFVGRRRCFFVVRRVLMRSIRMSLGLGVMALAAMAAAARADWNPGDPAKWPGRRSLVYFRGVHPGSLKLPIRVCQPAVLDSWPASV